MADAFVVGSLHGNEDPTQRRKVFVSLSVGYSSLTEAVEAAVRHWQTSLGGGTTPPVVIYQSPDGNAALVEIAGSPMTFDGLYKITKMQVAENSEAE